MSFIDTTLTTVLPKQESSKRKWGMLVVLSLALAIVILDTTILNVALSAIIQDLKTDIQSIQWVITAYALILAAFTITGGRLGDIFGRKKMFVLGAALFALGSFIASISQNVATLVTGESIIEGFGAALMMPATASLLVVNFKGRERAIAFGIWGAIAGAAAALGPIIGGYLTTHYDWRWGFRVNLIVVLLLLVGSFIIPESRDKEERSELDWTGVALSASGLLALVFGIIEASKYGWWAAKDTFLLRGHALTMPWELSIVPFCIAVGLFILVCFLWWEKRHEAMGHTPLVSLSLFRNRTFTTGVLTTTVMSLGQTGLIFALPVFLQAVRGLDAFQTGIALLPMPLALLVVAPLSAALGKKIPPKLLISLGLLVNVAAYLVLRYSLNVDTTSMELVPGLALFGVGMGLVMSQINNITLSAVSVEQAGEASGVNNTFRQLGATLGSAIIGTVLIGSLGNGLAEGIRGSAVIPDRMKTSLVEAVSRQTSNVEFGGGAKLRADVPKEIREEIVTISHRATVSANKKSLSYGAVFALLGFFASLLLPTVKKEEETRADEDVRASQARALWKKGWGRALGFATFEAYLASTPEVPAYLSVEDSAFPSLVLVDGRLSVLQASHLLGVVVNGNRTTASIPLMQDRRGVYWMRCQNGERFIGWSMDAAKQAGGSGEAGLDAAEGLAVLAQDSSLPRRHHLDLPNTPHPDWYPNGACLGLWNGKLELRWRRTDIADPRCGTGTKRG